MRSCTKSLELYECASLAYSSPTTCRIGITLHSVGSHSAPVGTDKLFPRSLDQLVVPTKKRLRCCGENSNPDIGLTAFDVRIECRNEVPDDVIAERRVRRTCTYRSIHARAPSTGGAELDNVVDVSRVVLRENT